MSEHDLAARAGEDAFVVLERGADLSRSQWAAHVTSLFEHVEVRDEVDLPNPRDAAELRHIRVLHADRIRPL
jgi:hypothetical protein